MVEVLGAVGRSLQSDLRVRDGDHGMFPGRHASGCDQLCIARDEQRGHEREGQCRGELAKRRDRNADTAGVADALLHDRRELEFSCGEHHTHIDRFVHQQPGYVHLGRRLLERDQHLHDDRIVSVPSQLHGYGEQPIGHRRAGECDGGLATAADSAPGVHAVVE